MPRADSDTMIGGASTASTGAVEVNARGNVALAPCADTTTSTVPAGLGAFVAVTAVATARAGLFSPTGTLRA